MFNKHRPLRKKSSEAYSGKWGSTRNRWNDIGSFAVNQEVGREQGRHGPRNEHYGDTGNQSVDVLIPAIVEVVDEQLIPGGTPDMLTSFTQPKKAQY